MFYYCPDCRKYFHLYSVLDTERGKNQFGCPDCLQFVLVEIKESDTPVDVVADYWNIEDSFTESHDPDWHNKF